MLEANGWDWERLLRGKVKVIADPFANIPKTPPPQATPANVKRTAPPPPPPPPKPNFQPNPSMGPTAANPFPGSFKPKPQPQPQASPPPQAPQRPLHFRKSAAGIWCIASYMKADQMIGQLVEVQKSNGDKPKETVGPFVEQDPDGYYLYKIAKAGKWKSKFANQSTVDDLL